jgi:hypothetical protein
VNFGEGQMREDALPFVLRTWRGYTVDNSPPGLRVAAGLGFLLPWPRFWVV